MNYSHQSLFILLIGILCLFSCQEDSPIELLEEKTVEDLQRERVRIVDYQLDGKDRLITYEWEDISPEANYTFQFVAGVEAELLGSIITNVNLTNEPSLESGALSITVLNPTSCLVRLRGDYLIDEQLVVNVSRSYKDNRRIIEPIQTSGPILNGPGGSAVIDLGIPPDMYAVACAGSCDYYNLSLLDLTGDGGLAREKSGIRVYYKRQDICDCDAQGNSLSEKILCMFLKPSYIPILITSCTL